MKTTPAAGLLQIKAGATVRIAVEPRPSAWGGLWLVERVVDRVATVRTSSAACPLHAVERFQVTVDALEVVREPGARELLIVRLDELADRSRALACCLRECPGSRHQTIEILGSSRGPDMNELRAILARAEEG